MQPLRGALTSPKWTSGLLEKLGQGVFFCGQDDLHLGFLTGPFPNYFGARTRLCL